MLKDLTIQLADLSDIAVIPVAAMSLLTFKSGSYFRLLSMYLLIISAFNLTTMITANSGINNSYLYHLIGISELGFIYTLYRQLGLNAIWNWPFAAVLVVYITDSIYLITNGVEEINSVGQSFGMLFIIVLGFNFLWKLYKEEKIEHLNRYPQFYISAGFTFFASGAFFGYLLIARLTDLAIPGESFYYSWIIIAGFTWVKCILIAVGIYIQKKYAK